MKTVVRGFINWMFLKMKEKVFRGMTMTLTYNSCISIFLMYILNFLLFIFLFLYIKKSDNWPNRPATDLRVPQSALWREAPAGMNKFSIIYSVGYTALLTILSALDRARTLCYFTWDREKESVSVVGCGLSHETEKLLEFRGGTGQFLPRWQGQTMVAAPPSVCCIFCEHWWMYPSTNPGHSVSYRKG